MLAEEPRIYRLLGWPFRDLPVASQIIAVLSTPHEVSLLPSAVKTTALTRL